VVHRVDLSDRVFFFLQNKLFFSYFSFEILNLNTVPTFRWTVECKHGSMVGVLVIYLHLLCRAMAAQQSFRGKSAAKLNRFRV
jgi:hypothetical protein